MAGNIRPELVANRDSKYQNLQLGVSHGQYCLFANGQLAAVFPDDDTHRILAAQLLSQHPRPRRILVIGEPPAAWPSTCCTIAIAR